METVEGILFVTTAWLVIGQLFLIAAPRVVFFEPLRSLYDVIDAIAIWPVFALLWFLDAIGFEL